MQSVQHSCCLVRCMDNRNRNAMSFAARRSVPDGDECDVGVISGYCPAHNGESNGKEHGTLNGNWDYIGGIYIYIYIYKNRKHMYIYIYIFLYIFLYG